MRRSTDEIITTHAGSLPRPESLRQAWTIAASHLGHDAEANAILKRSVDKVVASQGAAGIDIPTMVSLESQCDRLRILPLGAFTFSADCPDLARLPRTWPIQPET